MRFGNDLVRRLQSVDRRVYDALLAAAALVFVLAAMFRPGNVNELYDFRDVDALIVGCGIVSAFALLFRRHYPFTMHVLVMGCATGPSLANYDVGAIPTLVLVTLYTLASHGERRLSIAGLFVTWVCLLVMVVARVPGLEGINAVGTLVVFTAGWFVGDLVRSRRIRLEEAEQRATLLERQRTEDAHRAVMAERLRIAQELHDVVAHAMSVITIQSGVAAHLTERSPEQAREALRVIESTGRAGLQELRRMLGVLRAEGEDRAADLAPTPSLAELPSLVSRFRSLGVDVSLHQEGDPSGLPASLQLNAYRIVQESLTNVLRHAGPATVAVRLCVEPTQLVVEVIDDGLGAGTSLVEGAQQGIVGMLERVALFDGTLVVGPREDARGFAVRACFRIDAGPTEPTASPALVRSTAGDT